MRVQFTGALRPVRLCLAATAATWLGTAGAAAGDHPKRLTLPRPANAVMAAPEQGPAKVAPAGQALTLPECLAIAMERQPTIRAARASLSASLGGQRALDNIHPLTTIFAPDLPVRRQQAQNGVTVAVAEVQKAEFEAAHDVALLYYSYIYARQQEQTATDVVDQMNVWYGVAKDLLNSGQLPGGQPQLFTIEEAMAEVRKLRITARTGGRLALAALRDAMGIDPTGDIVPRDTELPLMDGTVTKQQVIDLALARRPEMIQAAAGVDAFRLEICAQDRIRNRQSVQTLASGSDLHSRQVPMPVRNGEYKPGVLAPEMPATLVGRREDRVARAVDYSNRQDEVYAIIRDKVRLEAINAFEAWADSNEKMAAAKERFDNSQKNLKIVRENIPNKRNYDDAVRFEALAGRAQADYVESVFNHVKALIRLQRVTAGGVMPAFPSR
jgi:outer membrane protein TolC